MICILFQVHINFLYSEGADVVLWPFSWYGKGPPTVVWIPEAVGEWKYTIFLVVKIAMFVNKRLPLLSPTSPYRSTI